MADNDKKYTVATVTREEIADVLGIEPECLTEAQMKSIAESLGRATKEWSVDSWESDIKIVTEEILYPVRF